MLGQNMKVYTCSILKIATEKEIISIDKIIYIISHVWKLKREATSEGTKVKDLSRRRMKKIEKIRQFRRQVMEEWGRERHLER